MHSNITIPPSSKEDLVSSRPLQLKALPFMARMNGKDYKLPLLNCS